MKNLTVGGRKGGQSDPFINFYLNYYWLMCQNFLFQISAISYHKLKFDFLQGEGGGGGKKGASIQKLESQLLLASTYKCFVSNFIKIAQ